MLTMMMLRIPPGMGTLALDGGRYMSLQTQMQSVADSLALRRSARAQPAGRRAGSRGPHCAIDKN